MREVILLSIKDIQSAIRRCSIDQDMFNINVLLAHAIQAIPQNALRLLYAGFQQHLQ